MKQSIKPIAVILSIILICGGILAVLHDLLYVSDNERVQRAIDKIYTEETVSLVGEPLDVSEFSDERGEIKACYALSNDDYLVLAKGKKGYSNGTVTLYVAVSTAGNVATVKKAVLSEYGGQTLMGKITALYQKLTGKTAQDVLNGVNDKSLIVSGASYSSTATDNATYVALAFVNALLEV